LRIDIQSGRLEGSLKSVNTIQLAEDDEDAWSVLIQDMEDLGITAELVNYHRPLALERIVKAINTGVFQELAPVEVTEVAKTVPMLNSLQTRVAETMDSEMQQSIDPLSKLDIRFWSLSPSTAAYHAIQSAGHIDPWDETKAKLEGMVTSYASDSTHQLRLRLNIAIYLSGGL
jgi:hypothetical protein